MTDDIYRCGVVAITGRPNVGKSTLLNYILGQKISITSRKPQTTRHRILGIKTDEESQVIYVDTPGLHKRKDIAINRYMNKAASSVVTDVDVILFVVQSMVFNEEDESALKVIGESEAPVILVISKIDLIDDREQLLPFIEMMRSKYAFDSIVPISAIQTDGIEELESTIKSYIPENQAIYAEDQITDRSMRFISAEIIREKLVRELGQELPYTTSVEIEKYVEEDDLVSIFATVYVESKGQKAIIIGKKGMRLKNIGSKARKDIEKMVDSKVYLQLWVKVREGWSNDEVALRSLGYTTE